MNIVHEIKKLIDEYSKQNYFTGGIKDDRVHAIEKELHVKLSESYIWFLKSYGRGGMFGIDIIG